MNQLVVEKQAAQFRAELGLSNTESIPLSSLLLKLEVLTVFKPLDMDVSGIAIKSGVRQKPDWGLKRRLGRAALFF